MPEVLGSNPPDVPIVTVIVWSFVDIIWLEITSIIACRSLINKNQQYRINMYLCITTAAAPLLCTEILLFIKISYLYKMLLRPLKATKLTCNRQIEEENQKSVAFSV